MLSRSRLCGVATGLNFSLKVLPLGLEVTPMPQPLEILSLSAEARSNQSLSQRGGIKRGKVACRQLASRVRAKPHSACCFRFVSPTIFHLVRASFGLWNSA